MRIKKQISLFLIDFADLLHLYSQTFRSCARHEYREMIMKLKNMTKWLRNLIWPEDKILYQKLTSPQYKTRPYYQSDLGEDMILVSQVIDEYIKPRYLMDCRTKRAVEFMDKAQRLLTVTDDDIDWRSLKRVKDEDAIDVARYRLFIYPGDISRYVNGMAKVRWEINPDGRFYCDEDGFGMTGDVEVTLYGVIDRKGKVVKKFTYSR